MKTKFTFKEIPYGSGRAKYNNFRQQTVESYDGNPFAFITRQGNIYYISPFWLMANEEDLPLYLSDDFLNDKLNIFFRTNLKALKSNGCIIWRNEKFKIYTGTLSNEQCDIIWKHIAQYDFDHELNSSYYDNKIKKQVAKFVLKQQSLSQKNNENLKTDNALLAPNGKFYDVFKYQNHEDFAFDILHHSLAHLEKAGWLHLSGGDWVGDYHSSIQWTPELLSQLPQAQLNTLYDWYVANNKKNSISI